MKTSTALLAALALATFGAGAASAQPHHTPTPPHHTVKKTVVKKTVVRKPAHKKVTCRYVVQHGRKTKVCK
ncbi:MAG: hypothetical protein J7530_08265 [Novosphingobium sp.]|nr:hypothetical protein [Novosphingobium sp.]